MVGYEYWRKALVLTGGTRPLTRMEMSGLGVSEDPQAGFFRQRAVARGPFADAVAIWEDGEWIATVNDILQIDPVATWLHACKFPVTEEAYRARIETGRWADEKEAT